MPTSCDPNDLAKLAKCFKCLPAGTLLEIQAYLLCQILNNGGTGGGAVTQLLAGTNITLSPANGLGSVTINASSGGSGQVLQGNGQPVAAPPVAGSPALYSDLVSGILWTWNVGTQAWQ